MCHEIDGSSSIFDGSAMAFVEAIDQAGVETLSVSDAEGIKPVRIENGASWAEFKPYDGTRFEIEIV